MPDITGIRNQVIPLEQVKLWIPPGWGDILDRLVRDLFEIGWDGNLHQAKEKFGGLRFYVGYITDDMRDRIMLAEKESIRTCETCGNPGTCEWINGWARTECEPCRAKHV